MLRVRQREPGHEGRGGDTEHAAVRLHHTTGLSRQGGAERHAGEEQQQERQVGEGGAGPKLDQVTAPNIYFAFVH